MHLLQAPTRATLALLLGLAITAAPPAFAAHGKSKGAASAKTKASGPKGEARRHVEAGMRLYRAADYSGARNEFAQADRVAPRATTLKLIADCSFKLNDYAAAFAQYSQLPQANGATKSDAKDAERMLKTLDLLTGQIEVSDNGAAVEVFIDDKSIGKTPLTAPVRVAAGPHKMRAAADGAKVWESDVNVKPQETAPVAIDAIVAKASGENAAATATSGGTVSASKSMGKVSVNVTPPEAAILIDGDERGNGMYEGELPIGSHKLTVLLAGYHNEERELQVTEADTALETVKLDAEGDDRASSKGMYVAGSLFGAIPVVGATTVPPVEGGTSASSLQLGGGAAIHGGYTFGLLSVEGTVAFLADRHTETQGVPGSTTPDSPDFQAGNNAHTESYLLYSSGGFLGVGPRITTPGRNLRLTGSISPGLSVRHFSMIREVGIGVVDSYATSTTAANFAITGDISVLIGKAPGLQVSIGLFAWVDMAGQTQTASGDPHVVTVPAGDHTVDAIVSTPPVNVQNGTEIFVGPQIGVRWGH